MTIDQHPPAPGFPAEVRPAFEVLKQDIIWLSQKLDLYRMGFLDEASREVLFSHTAHAFLVLQDSLTNDLIISIARLMDDAGSGSRTNLSLKHLFSLVRERGRNPDLASDIEAKLSSIEGVLVPIAKLRNKVLAHRDRTTALTTPLDLQLAADDITRVCRVLQEILNAIEGYFERSTFSYHYTVSYQDIRAVVRFLQGGIQGWEQELQLLKSQARQLDLPDTHC